MKDTHTSDDSVYIAMINPHSNILYVLCHQSLLYRWQVSYVEFMAILAKCLIRKLDGINIDGRVSSRCHLMAVWADSATADQDCR